MTPPYFVSLEISSYCNRRCHSLAHRQAVRDVRSGYRHEHQDLKIITVSRRLVRAYLKRKAFGDFVPIVHPDVLKQMNNLVKATRGE